MATVNSNYSADTNALAKASGATPLERALMTFCENTYFDFARYRFAEEREWYEMALFYQRRQWLSFNEGKRHWEIQKPDKKKPRPMPVSNYFAKTINANANALGAALPKILATPNDDDPINRRAADMVQRAKEALDKESGMHILNPLLAKHTALWGIGITEDHYDLSLSNGVTKVNLLQLKETNMLGCIDCGGSYDVGPQPPLDAQGNMPCPQCQKTTTFTYPQQDVDSVESKSYSRGKLCTEIVPIFEMFASRECRNLNLAKRLLRRTRKAVGTLEREYPDKKGQIKADSQLDIHDIYYTALKSLVNYNYLNEQTQPAVTVTRCWSYWEELTKELQDELTKEFAAEPDKLEMIVERGIYIIYTPGVMLDWGINPYYDEECGKAYMPWTFFLWEYDPANVYNKSVGTDLIPLQKRLNRLDSLIELAVMSNSAGKWIWPRTQTTAPPTGSPNDVIEFDPIGEGKIAPQFVQPSPFHEMVFNVRQSILGDFNALGLTEAVSTGATPQGGVNSFRGLAYLGSKAAEQINTQRTLWETSHQLRYEKLILMAKLYWDEPRKVKVAGGNGKFKAQALTGADLRGSYAIEFVPESSRPKTVQEKQAAIAALFQAKMIDPSDPSVRDFIYDTIGLDGVNLIGHRQFEKAERVLDQVRRGEQPLMVPGIDNNILYGVLTDYTLTEEFEQQDPNVQAAVLQFSAQIQLAIAEAQMRAAGMNPPPTPGMPAPAAPKSGSAQQPTAESVGNALHEHVHGQAAGPSQELNKVPGQGAAVDDVQNAAGAQANTVASQLQ